jgi:succinyl-CoA:acetate CoA-transferase
MYSDRIRSKELQDKLMSAEQAADFIKNGMIVATSGFTPSGYPKAVPMALAEKVKQGKKCNITLITGASVGDELDGCLTRAGIMNKRFPYQTNACLRKAINAGEVMYQDIHLSHVSQYMDYGYLGKIDIAVVEALAINADGGIVPTTSIGLSPQAIKNADKVIVEINISQPMALEGIHDIYSPKRPPNREPIPITKTGDRIGTFSIPCDIEKIVGIVISDIPDDIKDFKTVDQDSEKISAHIIEFLENEVKEGRLPENLLPLQSGVGSVANAVLGGLYKSKFENLTCYTEVIQDSMLDLIDSGKVTMASGTSLTPSKAGLIKFNDNIEFYSKHIILRPMEISNNPEVIRRLGVISMNTAIEADIYGHVNSTNIMGSRMMNGIGGSGDFTRNSYLSIFTTMSTAKNHSISSIVPMASHVDHTEHDVQVIVTEQGIADLRGTAPRERARLIINNCAHPMYRDRLLDYLDRAEKTQYKHEPHLLEEALSWHAQYLKTGSMK